MKKTTRNSIIATLSALAVVLFVVLAFCSQQIRPAPLPVHTTAIDMEVSIIDVGQGDSILVVSEGQSLLVDAGGRNSGDEVVACLRAQGIEVIDYLVATHGDADHIGGMAEVLRAYDVRHDIMAPEFANDTATYRGFVSAVQKEPGIGLKTPLVGTTFQLGDATVAVIANGQGEGAPNDSSIVLKVTCGGKSALLTGDMPEQAELKLVAASAPIDSDLLKVGHHGSKHSSSIVFLQAVSPEYAVISCGKNNTYGHPAPEALERLRAVGAQIWRTDECGTVVFLFSDGVISLQNAA